MRSGVHLPGRPRRTTRASVAVAALMVVATVPLVAGPAQSVPGPGCPTPYPTENLTVGQAVDGLTVTSGTTPGAFTGTIQGVLEDGIAPGVDMILADLSSTVIDRVGIWSGMSGSPVYTADGELIGAVSYGLSFGPSTIAGITPATDMAKLFTTPAPGRRMARAVHVPRRVATRIVRSGAASAAAMRRGLSPIRMPIQVSGLSPQRMAKIADHVDLGGAKVVAGPAGPTAVEAIPIQAGGNMAASLSYGAVTAAGIGTATMVCGTQVVGFGHPMNFSGPSTMTLHGARALLIQDDPTLTGFKLANVGAPIGRVDQDRIAGIRGVRGARPSSVPLTSVAAEPGARDTATTHATQQDLLPDIAYFNLHASQDRVLDRIGKGTALTSWTIKGLRRNARPFELSRRDLFTDSADVSSAPAFEVASQIAALQGNPGETVTITSVDTTSYLRDYSDTYVIAKVQARVGGTWATSRRSRPLTLREGRTTRLRVQLTSREADPRVVTLRVAVPKGAAGKTGTLSVTGGNAGSEEFFDEEEFFDFQGPTAPSPSDLPDLVKSLETEQHNNELRATLKLRGFRDGEPRTRRGDATINRAVGGRLDIRVRGVR